MNKQQFFNVLRAINKHLTERQRLYLLNFPNKGKKRTYSVRKNVNGISKPKNQHMTKRVAR